MLPCWVSRRQVAYKVSLFDSSRCHPRPRRGLRTSVLHIWTAQRVYTRRIWSLTWKSKQNCNFRIHDNSNDGAPAWLSQWVTLSVHLASHYQYWKEEVITHWGGIVGHRLDLPSTWEVMNRRKWWRFLLQMEECISRVEGGVCAAWGAFLLGASECFEILKVSYST